MRLLVFSVSNGAPYLYQDYERPEGSQRPEDGAALAARLFNVNKLLLQVTGERDDADGGSDQTTNAATNAAAAARSGLRGTYHVHNNGSFGATTGGGGGGATFLGGGSRSLHRTKSSPAAARSRLALRQWHLDSEQWQLAEDVEADVLLALSVPAEWDQDTAAQLARSLRDAFVHANRAQLLAMAATNAAIAAAASSLSAAADRGGAAQLPPPSPAPAFRSPPGGATPLLTLQLMKLLCRLAQEGLDALAAGGLRPSWLFVAHVDSFMGGQTNAAAAATAAVGPLRRSASAGAVTGAAGGSAADGGKADGGKKAKKGLLHSVLGVFRKGARRGGGGGGGRDGAGGGCGEDGGGGGARVGGGGGDSAWEPGPVGHLQHLVVPSGSGEARRVVEGEEEEEEVGLHGRRRAAAAAEVPRWDPTSIAAALWQVRPPPGTVRRQSSLPPGGGGGPQGDGGGRDGRAGRDAAAAAAAVGEADSFPELEDVELTMEVQLGGAGGPPQRFSVVGVRLRHVVAVVAQPAAPPGGAGVVSGDDGAERPPPAGSISCVRSLLRPLLVPLSSVFHYLARWAPQDEVAAHGLLLRLLE